MKERIKIFISAYACEPDLGSEIGVGWHWVLEMSKYFDLWVLTRKSNQKTIENWFEENKTENKINFIYYDLPSYLRFWKRGLRGVRTYYVLWQIITNIIVKRTMEDNAIDIYHLLTYGNALWSASKYGMKKFFIWGPIGISDVIPAEYSKHYILKDRIIEYMRRILIKMLILNRGFQTRCRNTNLILCKTENTLKHIPKQYNYKAIQFTDVAVNNKKLPDNILKNKKSDDKVHYIAAGRLDAWRGFDLLIEAFALAVKETNRISLEIIGQGSNEIRLRKLIAKYNLEKDMRLSGRVSMIEYYKRINNCDVVVNPCLREGGVTTAFDTFTFKKPLICIDTGGYTKYFNNDYAAVIPLSSRSEVISNIKMAIIKFAKEDVRISAVKKMEEVYELYTWEQKGKQVHKTILDAFNTFKVR